MFGNVLLLCGRMTPRWLVLMVWMRVFLSNRESLYKLSWGCSIAQSVFTQSLHSCLSKPFKVDSWVLLTFSGVTEFLNYHEGSFFYAVSGVTIPPVFKSQGPIMRRVTPHLLHITLPSLLHGGSSELEKYWAELLIKISFGLHAI